MLAWRMRSYAPVGSTASSPSTLCSFGEWCQATEPPTVTSPSPVRESLAPPARPDRSTSGQLASRRPCHEVLSAQRVGGAPALGGEGRCTQRAGQGQRGEAACFGGRCFQSLQCFHVVCLLVVMSIGFLWLRAAHGCVARRLAPRPVPVGRGRCVGPGVVGAGGRRCAMQQPPPPCARARRRNRPPPPARAAP